MPDAGPDAGRRAATQRLCHISELPDAGARGFDPWGRGRDTVFAMRRGDSVRVWADWCPHHGTPLPWRKNAYLNAAGDRIVCAAHGALFEIDSGVCVQGPCLGDCLRAVPFELDPDGEVMLAARTQAQDNTTAGDNT